jgi:tRNA wybutosine-synthesizing protein 1
MFHKINGPRHRNAWERWLQSLSFISQVNTRTVLRFTLIRNFNDNPTFLKDFAKLVEIGNPHFIELKSYMHIGMSTNRLEESNMLEMDEIRSFAGALKTHLRDYFIMDESIVSRIVVLQNKARFTSRWIESYP